MIEKNVILWIGEETNRLRVPVSQYDTMWELVFTIVNGSVEWEIPTGATASLNGVKPDGNVFAIAGTIDNNRVIVDADVQMTAVAGDTICELSISSNDMVVGTANFILAVEAAPLPDGSVESESRIDAYGAVIADEVGTYLDQHPEVIESVFSENFKQTLLACFQRVAWAVPNAQSYYNALYDAMMVKTVLAINAVFTQGSATIYDTNPIDSLKPYLAVTASYSDGTTGAVSAYTLSGTLSEGTSTITVSYMGKTDTFTVVVTESFLPSGYRSVDYIYSNATDGTHGTYVKTGASFSSPTTAVYKVIAQLEDGSSINGHAMCTRQKNTGSTNNTGFEMTFNPTLNYISSWSSISANYEAEDIFGKHEVVATWTPTQTTVEVDEDTPVSASGTARAIGGYPICIFGSKPATTNEGASNYYFFRGKIYYAEADQDGVAIAKCYPCVRESDSAVGFYDTINDAFYTGYSIGGKTIVAGYGE